MTSGNSVIDQYESDLRNKEKEERTMECGCPKPYCSCDRDTEE